MAKKKPQKPGPKPRPSDELRQYRLQIRLTEAERGKLEASATGDVSTWARDALLKMCR